MSSKELEEQWLRAVVLPKIATNLGADVTTLRIISISVQFIGLEEAFMLTNCYKAKIDYDRNDVAGDDGRNSLMLVVKKTPNVPADVFDAINFAALYSNEMHAYNVIVPTIARFSKIHLHFPTYYYGDLQRSAGQMVLADFTVDGWTMTKERVNLSLEHILLAVKYLATFHGIMYAIKRMDGDLFRTLIAPLREARYATEDTHPDWALILKFSVQRLTAVTRRHYPDVPERFLEKVRRVLGNNYDYGRQRVRPIEPIATLCHGDYLRNNVAYRYKADDPRQPYDVMMFDLQTMRYSSPMIDLTVFLALSAFKDVRQRHFKDIFATYCNQLAAVYTKHTDEAIPSYLSANNLLLEYIRYLPYSMGVAASFLMAVVDPDMMSEELLNNNRGAEVIEKHTMTRGGIVVDRELAHQTKELYDFVVKYDVDIAEGVDIE